LFIEGLICSAGPAPASAPGQASARPEFFSGGGHTLGSDDVESSFIPDPNAPPPAPGMLNTVRVMWYLLWY
jgi:UBX domain-containing protein 1